ncbi:MAG: response regulator [Thermodesulfobacteriota bacterium]|nr:response regulator [Thermodesulfobacteriota bacterium]
MADTSYLAGKRILVVDDEQDVLDTVEDVLESADVDVAIDFQTAMEKIDRQKYDLAILDIMGVNGLKLLEETVEKNIPTVMLTAHALNPETLLSSIAKGAISFLPKEKLAGLDEILNQLLAAHHAGQPTWKILFEELGEFFDEKFGPEWKEKNKDFWSEFSRTYYVSKGIQSRLTHDEKVLSKGI